MLKTLPLIHTPALPGFLASNPRKSKEVDNHATYPGINPERPTTHIRNKRSDTESQSGPSISAPRYSEKELPKTKRRSGTSGELGVRYEKKLLMLGLYRALKEKYDFTLDTNIEGVGAFDDVVFNYKENDGIEQRIYLQAKHKEDQKKKINYEDFLKPGNDDYVLYKYFIDYIEAIENFDGKGKIKSKYFIIYTNIDFQCPKSDDKGLRVHKKSEDEYFIFRKLDLSEHKPLEIFSTTDPQNDKKAPAFYQFSDKNKNDEDEKTRVIEVLKNKFREIYENKNDPTKLAKLMGNEDELKSKLEGYLKTLVFAVDQRNEKTLGYQIKEEIKQFYSDHPSQDQVDFIFEYALNEIGQWKDRTKAKPLTEKDNYFEEGSKKFASFPGLYPVLVYKNELSAPNIQFIKQRIEQLNEELHGFVSSGKQLWPISSETPWLSSLVIYQALKEGKDYASLDRHLLLTWSDLLKGHELILSTFERMDKSLFIIVGQPTDQANHPKLSEIVNKLTRIVGSSKNNPKQIIIIAPENHELLVKFRENLIPHYDMEYKKVEFGDLEPESQKKCLTEKKIRFQGKDEQISIKQLLGLEEGFPVSKETLDKLNLDASGLEILLRNPVVEIGNKQAQLNHLESAHYKTHTPIELEQLKRALAANPEDIFVFVGKENEVKQLLPEEQKNALKQFADTKSAPLDGSFILLNAGQEEEQFKHLCQQVDEARTGKKVEAGIVQPALYLLKKGNEGWVWTQTYTRDFYMDRCFYPVIVDKNKIKNLLTASHLSDFVVFSGINKEALLNLLRINEATEKANFHKATVVFSEEAAAQEEFDRLGSDPTQQGESIHWLKVKGEGSEQQLQWHRSWGDVSRLRRVLVNEDVVRTPFKEASLAESKERVVVLADEPGMGKTTTLTHVAEYLSQAEDSSPWVIKINLKQHQGLFSSIAIETSGDVINLLSDIVPELKNNPLSKNILAYQLEKPGHVVLLFDSFDEVKSEGANRHDRFNERQESIVKLFEFLKNNSGVTFWVATRPHMKEALEKRLSVLSFEFEPLTPPKQIEFLKKFWMHTLKLVVDESESLRLGDLKKYAKQLITHFDQSVQGDKQGKPFISIPLLARMLAEVFQERIWIAYDSKEKQLLQEGTKLAISDLYQQFIEKKYTLFLNEKFNIAGELDSESRKYLEQGYTKAHEPFALEEIFGSKGITLLTVDKKEKFTLELLLRIGLVQGDQTFVHRTFAEYFSAVFFVDMLKKPENHPKYKPIRDFLGEHIFEEKNKVMRTFFDHFLAQDLPLHRAALKGDISTFRESLRKNSDIDIRDSLGRTALHLAAQEGRGKIIKRLWEARADRLIRDQFGRIPLHYAARYGHDTVVKQLLKKHIDIDLDGHIFRTPLHFDAEVENGLFNNPEYAKSNLVTLVNEKDEAGKPPLYYAADNGHWDTACSLLLYGADSSVLTVEHKRDLLRFAAEKTHGSYGNQEHPLRPIVGFLSIQVPEAVQKLSDNYEYPRLLSYFFTNGHTKVINALLRSIEDVERRKRIANQEDNNKKPLNRIIEGNSNPSFFSDTDYFRVMKYFSEQGRELDIEIEVEQRNRFLEDAAWSGFLESFKYLFGYEVHKKGFFHPTNIQSNKENIYILFANVRLEDLNDAWLKQLIEASIKTFGCTRLHLAAMNKNIDSVNKLDVFINQNPPQFQYTYEDFKARDKNGYNYTPLGFAAENGNKKFIKILFDKIEVLNLDKNLLYEIINAKNTREGNTALYLVIYNKDYASTELLLHKIKDIGFSQKQLFDIIFIGLSPYIRNIDILELVFSYIENFNFSEEQLLKIFNGENNLLYKLIDGGFDKEALVLLKSIENLRLNHDVLSEIINAPNYKDGNTPLHAAASEGYCYAVVASLLKNGAVFNAPNRAEDTPMATFKNRHPKRETDSQEITYSLLNSVQELFN